MKKLILTCAVLLAVSIPAMAGFLFGGVSLLTVVTAQTNGPTFYTNSGYIYAPQITVTNATLSATNSYVGVFRFSVDNGTTWFTNSSPAFYPTNTVGQTYVIQAQSIQYPVLEQLLVITNTANTIPIQINATSP